MGDEQQPFLSMLIGLKEAKEQMAENNASPKALSLIEEAIRICSDDFDERFGNGPTITKQTYQGILHELAALGVDLVSSAYYPQTMGNFVVSFRVHGRELSLVNERFELLFYDALGGMGNCQSLLKDIRRRPFGEIRDLIRTAIGEPLGR